MAFTLNDIPKVESDHLSSWLLSIAQGQSMGWRWFPFYSRTRRCEVWEGRPSCGDAAWSGASDACGP